MAIGNLGMSIRVSTRIDHWHYQSMPWHSAGANRNSLLVQREISIENFTD
jgi:hypothetical protein